MAAEINWHRYGTKRRHCRRMYAICRGILRSTWRPSVLFELQGTKRDVPKVTINYTVDLLFQTTIRRTEDWTFANDLRLFDKSL